MSRQTNTPNRSGWRKLQIVCQFSTRSQDDATDDVVELMRRRERCRCVYVAWAVDWSLLFLWRSGTISCRQLNKSYFNRRPVLAVPAKIYISLIGKVRETFLVDRQQNDHSKHWHHMVAKFIWAIIETKTTTTTQSCGGNHRSFTPLFRQKKPIQIILRFGFSDEVGRVFASYQNVILVLWGEFDWCSPPKYVCT